MRTPARAGYSLYELVMTIGIAAVVLSLGVPALGGLIADQRLRVDVAALFHAMHLARQESVFRRRAVTLCPSRDGRNCDKSSDWSDGWILFVNRDRDSPARRDPDEPVLRQYSPDSHNRIVANRLSFTFRTTALRATNGTVIFCDRSRRAASRAIVVSHTGRPRVSRFDRDGNPHECRDYVKLTSPF